jgi:methyltransferase (TIGR00027 family)
VYVSVDFETEDFGQHLIEQGYEKSQKTLFVMEGLVYYLTSKTVDDMLSFVTKNSAKGSAVLFDYYPQSLIDGTCELEVAKNILNSAEKTGEPFQFGIENVGIFLIQREFSQVCNVTSDDYKNMYFHGINKDREVCSLLSFAHAVIE